MNRKFWFYLESYLHVSLKGNSLLLYNPYTGKILEYQPGDQGQTLILKLIRRLLNSKNLRVIPLNESELADPIIARFVNDMRGYFMGDLIDSQCSSGKPIQMPPYVKIQKDVKYLEADSSRSVGEEVLTYLTEITFYLNDRCSQGCSLCHQAYKQLICCTAGTQANKELNYNDISRLFNELNSCLNLDTVNICGGNILTYSQLEILVALLASFAKYQVNYFIHYLNIIDHADRLPLLISANSHLKIIVSFPLDEEKLKQTFELACQAGITATPVFFIQKEKEYKQAEAFLAKNAPFIPANDSRFHAFYNGKNLDFLKKNVYTERQDIEGARPSLKDIYMRGALNATYFGKLVVLVDQKIYADVNSQSLGLLGQNSIYDVLFKEMEQGKSWRRLRKNASPCKNCNFEKLCPPLSNYHKIISKNNLCHIYKNNLNY